MKSFRRSRKALSPVVASIILVAVTVAVSIAVAVWMGSLSTGFMQTEQLTITSATFGTPGVTLYVSNTGTTSVTINQVWNGTILVPTWTGTMAGGTLAANAQGTVIITSAFVSGSNYAFKLVSTKGNAFQYTAIAP
jgi:flagellin-like protein